ncbi:MAG: hypothetical protein WCK34_19020 [Bacteroidota bacterium]
MKTLSLNLLKKELATRPPDELATLCLQLAKYKKENKELLGYLLFDSNYEPEYIAGVKKQIDGEFAEINRSTLYFIKKSVRKTLRTTNKYIRYSGRKRTEADLRIYFCTLLGRQGIPLKPGTALGNIFDGQMAKIGKVVSALHEDLQHDYAEEIRLIGRGSVKET